MSVFVVYYPNTVFVTTALPQYAVWGVTCPSLTKQYMFSGPVHCHWSLFRPYMIAFVFVFGACILCPTASEVISSAANQLICYSLRICSHTFNMFSG